MSPLLRYALLSSALLLSIHCSSSSAPSGGEECVEPVVNAPCSQSTIFCPTAPVPATDCPNDCPAGSCFMAQGWGCEMGVASFSGALLCESDAGSGDGGASTVQKGDGG